MWNQVVQRFVYQDSELEFYSLTNWQQVELSQKWSDVFVSSCTLETYQTIEVNGDDQW